MPRNDAPDPLKVGGSFASGSQMIPSEKLKVNGPSRVRSSRESLLRSASVNPGAVCSVGGVSSPSPLHAMQATRLTSLQAALGPSVVTWKDGRLGWAGGLRNECVPAPACHPEQRCACPLSTARGRGLRARTPVPSGLSLPGLPRCSGGSDPSRWERATWLPCPSTHSAGSGQLWVLGGPAPKPALSCDPTGADSPASGGGAAGRRGGSSPLDG